MGSRISKIEKSTSAAESTKVSDSSGASTEVSPLLESFFNELTECIEEMYKENDPPCHQFDVHFEDAARQEIGSILRIALQNRNDVAMDEKKWPVMKVSKRKAMKAWLKEHFRRNGKGFIAKFFRVLRRLRKAYKKITKKSIQGIKNISKEWRLAIRLILLIAVIALLVGAVIAMVVSAPPMVEIALAFASLVLSFFQFLQDWCENLLREHGQKVRDDKGSTSGSLKEMGENNEDFTVIVKVEFRNVEKTMERFTGAFEDLGQLANSFKRMMEDGRKAVKKKNGEIKSKLAN